MSAHTPGPWRNHVAMRVDGGLVFWIQANPSAGWGNTICTVSSGIDKGNSDLIEPVCRANGDLIAAAPALADELEKRGTHNLTCPSTREIGRMGSRSGLYWNRATDAATCKCGLGAVLRAAGRLP